VLGKRMIRSRRPRREGGSTISRFLAWGVRWSDLSIANWSAVMHRISLFDVYWPGPSSLNLCKASCRWSEYPVSIGRWRGPEPFIIHIHRTPEVSAVEHGSTPGMPYSDCTTVVRSWSDSRFFQCYVFSCECLHYLYPALPCLWMAPEDDAGIS
jgi:hypothetical protein